MTFQNMRAKWTALVGLIVACFLLGQAGPAFAKNRDWMDAVVSDARSGPGGAVGIAAGTATSSGTVATGMAAAVAVPVDHTYYWIATKDVTYVISCFPRAISNGWRCPNLTVHGHTHIAIDGSNAHILDDDGKDRKVPIVLKVARTDQSSPLPSARAQDVPQGPPATLVTIYFTSDPDGAEINIDDAPVGKAPMTLKLKPGKHAIRMFMNGYQNWGQWPTIQAGADVHIKAALTKSNE